MNLNRIAVLSALLGLFFFVSTSAGLADISAVQGQLRALQLKLVGQKILLLQNAISEASHQQQQTLSVREENVTPEEMSRRIQNQISALESLVASLKPKILDEKTAQLEARISAIDAQIQVATGPRLAELQNELAAAVEEYNGLTQEVRGALEASLKERQVVALEEQLKLLQERVILLPRPTKPAPPDYSVLQDQVEKAQLKLLQAKMQAIQEKIRQVYSQ
ncbi:MAG: hypothetical protein HY221_02515 [Candidatus Sungbacteria bacterium]|uniref:Uncharacterized protein n=1 Tax=Candidatus Sungiibacteriota bacterium TaxID=2750080 RepID=A0A932QYI2_9BACT|nr:hypothetical protein [Candidatus Sungbacteria bacterium]